ncbi:MAG: hypothetical protein J6I41_02325 [Bacteroidales bacterium]|nr:hypothetical protein [Bacteroidales bacterium]
MEQAQVIERIKELGRRILPEGPLLWLYGTLSEAMLLAGNDKTKNR